MCNLFDIILDGDIDTALDALKIMNYNEISLHGEFTHGTEVHIEKNKIGRAHV